MRTASRSRDEVAFDEKLDELARAAHKQRSAQSRLSEQTRKVEPDDETARLLAEGIARVGIDKLPWTKALTQWRDRVMFLRRSEGDEWPDLSDAALAADVGLARAGARRQDRAVGTRRPTTCTPP